jgi:hypothetical protein
MPILYAIAILVMTLSFWALDSWDKCQEGQGFQGIFKILRRLAKLCLLLFGMIVVLVGASSFSAIGFWAGVFGLLLLPSTGTLCLPLSFFGFLAVMFAILNARSR